MLPDGWKKIPLHRLAEVRTGIAKGKSGLKDPIALPYLRVANVQDGHLDLAEIKTIQVEQSQVERYSLQHGDVLMTEGGDFDKLGRGAVWKDQLPRCLHQNHVFAVRPDKAKLEPEFLSALAGSEYGRNYFLSCAKRSTNLASINSSQLKSFPVLTPSVAEQRRIADVLTTWEQAIATSVQLSVNSRKHQILLATALLTGRRRFGQHPPWIATPLSQMIRESRSPGSGGNTARKLTVKLYGRGVVSKPEKRVGSESTRYYRRFAGQFIYSKLDFLNGAFGRVPPHLDGYESTLDLPAFDFMPCVDPRWFVYFVSRPDFYLGHLGLANGGRKARRVNPIDLLDVCVDMPTLSEQRVIADALDLANQECAMNQRRFEILKQEKAALMDELFAGKRRVRLPDGEATP